MNIVLEMTFLELFTFWDSNLKKPTVQLYIQNVLNFRNSRKGNVSFVWSLAEKIIISPLMIRHRLSLKIGRAAF